jgi:tRNA A37 methylthiotransferase MiaB
MTYWYPGVRQAARLLRERFTATPLLLGGGYAAHLPAHAAATPGVSGIVAARHPTLAWRELARRLALRPPAAEEWREVVPAWDLVPEAPHAALLTSLGCPQRCSYCATPLSFPHWQPRSHASLVTEVELLSRRPPRDLALYDDALLHRSREHFLPLVDRLTRLPGAERLRWHLPNAVTPSALDRPVARALRRLGVQTLWLAVEGFDAEVREGSDEKLTVDQLDASLAALDAERFRPRRLGGYLLAGLPGQAVDEVYASLEAVHARGLRIAVASYSPIPGTPSFARCAAALPALAEEPLWQNNTLWERRLPAVWEPLRRRVRELNSRLARRRPPDAAGAGNASGGEAAASL